MNKLVIIIMVLAFVVVSGSAFAFSDNFDSYATGSLTVVSGGVWNLWGGGPGTDAQVTAQGLSAPNAQYHDGIGVPDVVAHWSNLFGGGGGGRFSFDFLVHEEGEDDMDDYVFVGSGNPALMDIDYGSSIGVFIVDWGGSLGSTSLDIWDVAGAGGGGDYGIINLGSGLALDVWHHVDLIGWLTVADPTSNDPLAEDGKFEVWLNGSPVLGPTSFGLDNAFGWNATEIYSFDAGGDFPEQDDYTLFDNVEAVPEPSIFLLAGLGLLALIRRKK